MNLSEKDINRAEDYLRGLLTKEQNIAFEREMELNSELKSYIELSKQLDANLGETDWQFNSNEDSADLKAMIDFIKSKEGQQSRDLIEKVGKSNQKLSVAPKKNYYFYAIAASLVILLAVSWFVDFGTSNDELYSSYSDYSNLPSFVSRGEEDKDGLFKAETFFENKQYEEASEIFTSYLKASKDNGAVYIYQGLSQIELEQYDAAEQTFNTLIKSDLLDAPKGYWYSALLCLKQDKINEAKALLTEIVEKSYYNHIKAEALLSDLK
ncbi:tetratricopeptide repeat protein [uncultured Psychroserpens sp.]|uniref:tetratricopeptide repeat protein n=1 Tax=uncultured Psychroserpens sp. TaxID=255436 RepID=UPI002610F5AE|nr:tetratricopeptide repeat protein [uncultured Psychroserpens sp.]